MDQKEIDNRVLELVAEFAAGRKAVPAAGTRKYFPFPAYNFVMEALENAMRAARRRDPAHKASLSGAELAAGICDSAKELYGSLALDVFHNWNFYTTRDLGEAVYGLIDVGVFYDDPNDRIEDFDDLFDLEAKLRD